MAELLAQVIDCSYISPIMRVPLDSDNPIIAFRLFAFTLFALDHTDRAAGQHTSGKCRLIHKHQYVNRIAVVGPGGGYKAKVIREFHSARQDPLQLKDMLIRIKSKLVAASFRSFDHDP